MRFLGAFLLIVSLALMCVACPTLPEPKPDVEKVHQDHKASDRDLEREEAKQKDRPD